ncbi:alpha/beta fold hydrolase [Streptomyces rochei]|uniref:alpha/beta fold hydrolase n=1 Tax=Streptomyces rochei TaxID=1928 RepID=UPI0040628F99
MIADLRTDHRVIAPTLPYGAHRRPLSRPPTPDLVNELIAEFLERLDLIGVTLVENDCGRAQTVAARHPERLARLALIACEAFDTYPPGLPGKMIGAACRVPGGVSLLVRVLGLRPLRRLPVGIGALTKRPVPDAVVDGWLRPRPPLAELLPQGRLVEIEDTRTLIPEDQPELLASLLREFIADTR